MIILLIWLGATVIFMTDASLLMYTMRDRVSEGVRQLWMGAPLVYAPLILLFSPWARWVAMVLSAVLFLHLAVYLVWQRRLTHTLRNAPPDVVVRVAALARRWGTAPPARVFLGAGDQAGPAVLGLVRPVLILPDAALALPEQEWEGVIAHELAHIRRGDPLKLWLLGVARTLLSWLPVARPLLNQLPLEIELAADSQATAWLGNRRTYALALGRWGLRHAAYPVGVALTGSPSHLVLRLQALTQPALYLGDLYMPVWWPRLFRRRKPPGEAPEVRPLISYLIVLYLSLGYSVATIILLRYLG